MNKYNTIIWLDDIRNPLDFLKNIEFKKLVWVKNYDEFKTTVMNSNMMGLFISFDHDIADEHYTPKKYWDDYEASKIYQESQNYKEKTGYDCAKWLVDLCIKHDMNFPDYNVHSANPVGADNIRNYIENFKKTKK